MRQHVYGRPTDPVALKEPRRQRDHFGWNDIGSVNRKHIQEASSDDRGCRLLPVNHLQVVPGSPDALNAAETILAPGNTVSLPHQSSSCGLWTNDPPVDHLPVQGSSGGGQLPTPAAGTPPFSEMAGQIMSTTSHGTRQRQKTGMEQDKEHLETLTKFFKDADTYRPRVQGALSRPQDISGAHHPTKYPEVFSPVISQAQQSSELV